MQLLALAITLIGLSSPASAQQPAPPTAPSAAPLPLYDQMRQGARAKGLVLQQQNTAAAPQVNPTQTAAAPPPATGSLSAAAPAMMPGSGSGPNVTLPVGASGQGGQIMLTADEQAALTTLQQQVNSLGASGAPANASGLSILQTPTDDPQAAGQQLNQQSAAIQSAVKSFKQELDQQQNQ